MSAEPGYLLVVEDVPDILMLLDASLRFKGYRVVTAVNGQDALNAIEKEKPALIITDILMPKMDGFSLVHRLRLNPETRSIPVIFLSATYVAPEDKAFALTIGATRFIEKPVDLEKFLPIVERTLQMGISTGPRPLNEVDFYEGYRKRLETKLKQKITQIARDEQLLESLSGEERQAFKSSLHQAISERDEIQHLLHQIDEQLDKLNKAE